MIILNGKKLVVRIVGTDNVIVKFCNEQTDNVATENPTAEDGDVNV